MDLYYDRRGRKLDRAEWLRASIARGRVTEQVARTWTARGVVSTIFTAMDLGFGWGPPLLYETMVFGGPLDGACGRYPTLRLARAGHREYVRLLKSAGAGRGRILIHKGRKPRF